MCAVKVYIYLMRSLHTRSNSYLDRSSECCRSSLLFSVQYNSQAARQAGRQSPLGDVIDTTRRHIVPSHAQFPPVSFLYTTLAYYAPSSH